MLWGTVLQKSGSWLCALVPFFWFSTCQRRTRRISQSLEKETREESTKTNSPGWRQHSVHLLCSRLPQPHKVDAFLYRQQVCCRFRGNSEKHKCLIVAELTTTSESEVKMYGYDFLRCVCLWKYSYLSVCVNTFSCKWTQ